MKRTISTILLVALCSLLLSSPIPVAAQEAQTKGTEPPFRTLRVTYKTLSKDFDKEQKPISENQGKEVRTIDAVRSMARNEQLFEDASGSVQNWVVIFDGTNTYLVDLVKKEAVLHPGRSALMTEPLWRDRPEATGESLVETAEVAGKSCDVYQSEIPGEMTLRSWYWKGVLLKQEMKGKEYYHLKEALSVEEDVSLGDELFQVPEGIPIKSEELAEQEEAERLAEEIPKPPFKTIKITYKTARTMKDKEGNPVTHTEEQEIKWIDIDQGKKRVERRAVSARPGPSLPVGTPGELEIHDGQRLYRVDQSLGLATYVDLPPFVKSVFWVDSRSDERFHVGKEEILGRMCNVYERGGNKQWIWNNLLLKEESSSMGFSSSLEAVEIEENLPIGPEMFKLPEGLTVQSVDSMLESAEKYQVSAGAFWEEQPKWAEAVAGKIGISGIDNMDLMLAVLNPKAEEKVIETIRKSSGVDDEKKHRRIGILQEELSKRRAVADQAMPEYTKKFMSQLVVPQWLQRSHHADFAEAVFHGSLLYCRMFVMGLGEYRKAHDSYPENLGRLEGQKGLPLPEGYLEKMVSEQGLQGYRYFYSVLDQDHFELLVKPIEPGGKVIFFDETGVLRLDSKDGAVISADQQPASAESPSG